MKNIFIASRIRTKNGQLITREILGAYKDKQTIIEEISPEDETKLLQWVENSPTSTSGYYSYKSVGGETIQGEILIVKHKIK